MVVLAERAIEIVLNDAMQTFRSNLSYYVSDIYAQETSANQTQITDWFSQSTNTITIQQGYNLQNQKEPQIAITTEAGAEVGNRRSIGQVGNQANGQTVFQTPMDGSFALHSIGPNQNFLLWMQAWVQWALGYERKTLLDTYGLMNQRIQLQPLRPVPDSLHDVVFPFMRTVTLNCQYFNSWSDPASATVTGGSITQA